MPSAHRLFSPPIRLPGVAALFLILAAAAPAGEAARPRIGVSLMAGEENPFFKGMLAGMRRAADSRGIELLVHDAEYSQANQNRWLDRQIAGRPNLVIVNPIDSREVVPALKRVGAVGIPVMTVDTDAEWPGVICNVASDNVAGGRLAAGLALERLTELGIARGDILTLDHEGATSTGNRVKGFGDVMRLRGRDFRLRPLDGGGLRESAREAAASRLIEPETGVVAVFAANAAMAMGALEAIDALGLAEKILVIGHDLNEETRREVDAGRLAGVVAQFPARIGETVIRLAGSVISGRGEFPGRFSLIEVGVYTREGLLDQRGGPISE